MTAIILFAQRMVRQEQQGLVVMTNSNCPYWVKLADDWVKVTDGWVKMADGWLKVADDWVKMADDLVKVTGVTVFIIIGHFD